MAIETGVFAGVLEEALTERDTQLQEKELPEIVINEALPIENQSDLFIEYVEYGVTSVNGSLDDGLIGNKTNSLKTIDSDIEMFRATWAHWGKAAVWTEAEAAKVAKLGIDAVRTKQDALFNNAMATVQYAGFLGHKQAKDQEGLLNSTTVTVTNTINKTIAAMTAQEVINMVLGAYGAVWKRTGYRQAPTAIGFDAEDFMALMSKFDTGGAIVGLDLLPLSALDKIMAALRKSSGNENLTVEFIKIPSNYARGIVSGKTRMAVYTKDADAVSMRVYAPEILPVRQRDLLTYESGYQAGFSGALWKQPLSATYVDYNTSV
ncbi:MAG: hypothetical protein RIQ74_1147 [Pseudomonadota bacterium]|jgi:hypothetical protein